MQAFGLKGSGMVGIDDREAYLAASRGWTASAPNPYFQLSLQLASSLLHTITKLCRNRQRVSCNCSCAGGKRANLPTTASLPSLLPMNLLLLAQPARWCAATAPHRAAAAPRLMAAVRRLGTASGGGHTEPLPATLHQTAEQGPQPETLFRPDAGHLQVCQCSGGRQPLARGRGVGCPSPCCLTASPSPPQEGEGREGKEEELPFPSIPHPDYGVERPQEQTAPEPENPLPDLPPNHPDEVCILPSIMSMFTDG